MKIGDRLNSDIKKALNDISKPKKKKKSEKLSHKDLMDLMGMNRSRYERRGGAIRRK